MAVLTAILNSTHFVDGASEMAQGLDYLIDKLDESYRSMQKFEATILTFSGSVPQANADLKNLLDIANDLGVSFDAAIMPFAKFASASEGLARSDIFGIFESFSTALSAVRANGSEVNGVFLALQQIVSKGKLSMEELRLQLAERIPGAMKIAAQAAGMSMAEFEKAVRAGTIDTNVWLVDFAKLIKEKFADAAELSAKSFDASMKRIQNSMLFFQADVVKVSDSGSVWAEIVNRISSSLVENNGVFESSSRIVRDFSDIALMLVDDILPLIPPALELISGATSLAGRSVAAFSLVLNGLYTVSSGIQTLFLELAKSVYELSHPFNQSEEELLKFDQLIIDSKIKTMDYAETSRKNLESLLKPWEDINRVVDEHSSIIDSVSKANAQASKEMKEIAGTISSSIKEQLEAFEKANKEKSDTINDMYKTAGFGAEAYYNQEAQKLVEQVAGWQKYGADVYESNQWLYTQLDQLASEAWSKGEEQAGFALNSYRDMYMSLVDQFNQGNVFIDSNIQAMANSIDGLNAKKIDIKASLDGGAVITGIDSLIEKFQEFQRVAAQAASYSENTAGYYDENSSVSVPAPSSGASVLSTSPKLSAGTTIVNNFNQSISKSDIVDISTSQQVLDSRL